MKPLIALLLMASPVWALDVPSGQPVELQEVLVDETTATKMVRFRFLAPAITRDTGTMTYADSVQDIEDLCARVALPYMAEYALTADVVVISLADRAVEFGQATPEATQFFDAFRIENGTCIWDDF